MVVINDMIMPQNCCKCPFSDGHFVNGISVLNCVTKTGRQMYAPDLFERTNRPEWCPLRNVSEITDKDVIERG